MYFDYKKKYCFYLSLFFLCLPLRKVLKMRVTFAPPSENEFKHLFLSSPLKKGGGLDDINIFQPRGIPHRRGSGIFSILSGVAKKVLPFLVKAAKPAAKEFGSSVLKDVLNKKPLGQSLKKHGVKALKKTGARLIRGSGKVRKVKKKNLKKKKKKNRKNMKKKKNKKSSHSNSYKTCIFD